MTIKEKTITLIDQLKATCTSFGMGNDGNEYKIITQVFLYKFLNDKFGYELKNSDSPFKSKFASAEKWEEVYSSLNESDREMLRYAISPDVPFLKPEHLISNLWNQQTKGDFDLIFDRTMTDIADENIDIFSTQTDQNVKIPLFEPLTGYVTNPSDRAAFARAVVDKLVNFSFEEAFGESYDFFSGIFEYLIKDYNTAGGGKYAEYYTPRAIATIMARLLVGDNPDLHNVECYDPSAGTGTLLMALAHQVGNDKATIFAQDISQRSNKMLKLNLILNGLVSSLDHAIQGDTLVAPYHKSDDGKQSRQFDFVVSNPPFKMDFSDTHAKIAAQPARFWAGVPNIHKKDIDKMAIYTCFIQHVINSIKTGGRGAIVIPTGFLTAKNGVERRVLKRIVDDKVVYGCISMPSNVFANTPTNVSVLFFDKSKRADKVILIDASKLGEDYKEDNLQKHRLLPNEIDLIVDVFQNQRTVDRFSVAVSYDDIKKRNYALSAGQYYEVKIEYTDIDESEFVENISQMTFELQSLFDESHNLEQDIIQNLNNISLS
ncbi:MAG: class I SAM-dependent DNA methyltransferase [Candidatus Onthomorpha sp.]